MHYLITFIINYKTFLFYIVQSTSPESLKEKVQGKFNVFNWHMDFLNYYESIVMNVCWNLCLQLEDILILIY